MKGPQDSCASAWEHESGFTAAGWAQITMWCCTQLHQTSIKSIGKHPQGAATRNPLAHKKERWQDVARILHCVFPGSLEVSFLMSHLSSTLLGQGHPHSLQDPAFLVPQSESRLVCSKKENAIAILTLQSTPYSAPQSLKTGDLTISRQRLRDKSLAKPSSGHLKTGGRSHHVCWVIFERQTEGKFLHIYEIRKEEFFENTTTKRGRPRVWARIGVPPLVLWRQSSNGGWQRVLYHHWSCFKSAVSPR